jgi:hypothetical protein
MAFTSKDAAGAVVSFISRLVGSDHVAAVDIYNGANAVGPSNRLAVDTTGTVTVGAALPAGGNNIGDVDVLTVPLTSTTTRGYSLANALRVAFTATSTTEAALPTMGASREIRFAPSARCWVKWGATGLTAAAPEAASFVLEANSPEVLQIPAGATHFRVVRDSADGNLLLTPVA